MPLPEPVHLMLTEYRALIHAALPGYMTGLYLHGSVALDAFTPNQSDVDFIAVISRRSTDSDIEHLRAIHHKIEQTHRSAPLQGSYLQPHHLGQFPDAVEKGPVYSDGELIAAAHHDLNSITWWLLKHRGITIEGPEASGLDFTVDWDLLLAETKKNLNTYWVRFLRQPDRMAWMLTDYGVQWIVLGTLRQWYTFKERNIVSKVGAGEYGLLHLPARWHPIIREAISIRQGTPSHYRFRLWRAINTALFLRFIIRECNTTFA